MELLFAMAGSSVITAIIMTIANRSKTIADARLADVTADDKTVQMALAFADAADKKAKDIEFKMQEFKTDFGKLEEKWNSLSLDHIALLKYNAECRVVIASFAPGHPILAAMPVSII